MTKRNLLLLSLLAACAPTTISYEDVRITNDPAVPARCSLLGEVVGGGDTLAGIGSTSTTVVPTATSQDPIVSLRQGTADLGGNTVVVVGSGDSLAGSSITGEAYDCSGYAPQ